MQSEHNYTDFHNVHFCKLMLTDSPNQLYTQVFYILQMDRLHMLEDSNIWLGDIHQFDTMH